MDKKLPKSSITDEQFNKMYHNISEDCFNNVKSNINSTQLRQKRIPDLGEEFINVTLEQSPQEEKKIIIEELEKKGFQLEFNFDDESGKNPKEKQEATKVNKKEKGFKLEFNFDGEKMEIEESNQKPKVRLCFTEEDEEIKKKLKDILQEQQKNNEESKKKHPKNLEIGKFFIGSTSKSEKKNTKGLIHKGDHLYSISGTGSERFCFFLSETITENGNVTFVFNFLVHFKNNEIDHTNFSMLCQNINNKYASQTDYWRDDLEDKLIYHSKKGFQINIPDLSYKLDDSSKDIFSFKSNDKVFSLCLSKQYDFGEEFEFENCVGRFTSEEGSNVSEASFKCKLTQFYDENMTLCLPMNKQCLKTSLFSLKECETLEDYFTYVNREFQFKIKFGKEFEYSNENFFSLKSKEIEIKLSKISLDNTILLTSDKIKFTGKLSNEISFSAEFPQKNDCSEKVDKILESFEFNSTMYKKNVIGKVSEIKFKF
jgi:hypothetical protein